MAAETSEDIDVQQLLQSRDKIKALMRRDPKFIGRLINVSYQYPRRTQRMRLWEAMPRLRCCVCAAPLRTDPGTLPAPDGSAPPPPGPRLLGRNDRAQQLDSQMHKMMAEKHQRMEAIRADEAALAKLEATIASHITPQLVTGGLRVARFRAACHCTGVCACRAVWDALHAWLTPCMPAPHAGFGSWNAAARQERLEAGMAAKAALRDAVAAQLESQLGSCRDLGREVAALVSKARHTSGKLMVSAGVGFPSPGGTTVNVRLHRLLHAGGVRHLAHCDRDLAATQAKTASHRLQEARGFSATVPTTQLIRGKPKQQPAAAAGDTVAGLPAAAAATGSRAWQQQQAAPDGSPPM